FNISSVVAKSISCGTTPSKISCTTPSTTRSE
ncbi:unnamed protein product, partial [Rotaria sordida]